MNNDTNILLVNGALPRCLAEQHLARIPFGNSHNLIDLHHSKWGNGKFENFPIPFHYGTTVHNCLAVRLFRITTLNSHLSHNLILDPAPHHQPPNTPSSQHQPSMSNSTDAEKILHICLELQKLNLTPKEFIHGLLTKKTAGFDFPYRRQTWATPYGSKSTLNLVRAIAQLFLQSQQGAATWAEYILEEVMSPSSTPGVTSIGSHVTHPASFVLGTLGCPNLSKTKTTVGWMVPEFPNGDT